MSQPSHGLKPQHAIGAVVAHTDYGRGRVLRYEDEGYVLLLKNGETKWVGFQSQSLKAVESAGDPELSRIKQVVQEVLLDHGWLDAELEMGKRWVGGTVRMIPGDDAAQVKDVPIEAFFKKIIGVREKLRVLEQKINNHPGLASEEKIELEGYITRCYGSLTTFNVLFANKESYFKGSGGKED
jgi:hypothetical protein